MLESEIDTYLEGLVQYSINVQQITLWKVQCGHDRLMISARNMHNPHSSSLHDCSRELHQCLFGWYTLTCCAKD
jgi:hypothetical protein